MRTVHRSLPLLGALLGPVPLITDLVLTSSGLAHASTPSYPLYGTLIVAALFLVYWLLDLRAKDGPPPVGGPTLWSAAGLAVLTSAFSFSYVSGYAQTELHGGQTYALMSHLLAAGAVSALQLLVAAVMLLAHWGERRTTRRGIALATVLVMLAGLGAVTEHQTRSLRPFSEHVTTSGDHASPDFPAQMEGTVHNLDIPEEGVLGLRPISSGTLLTLSDGVMAVDPLTGEELWRYRQPGTEAQTWVSPDMETVVVEAAPRGTFEEPDLPTIRVTLDVSSGEVVHSVENHQHLLGDDMPEVAEDKPSFEGEGVIVQTGTSPVLQAFGVSSGALLWSFNGSPECTPDTSHDEYVINSPTVTQEHVYVPVRCLGTDGEPSPDAPCHRSRPGGVHRRASVDSRGRGRGRGRRGYRHSLS